VLNEQDRSQLLRGIMGLDVVSLWNELTFEWVTDLRMVLEPVRGDDSRCYLRLSVISIRYDDDHPAGYEYVWAFQTFPQMGYSISPAQLFELLIFAKWAIIRVLRDNDAPPRQPIKEP